ncbi:hypothetical protein ASPVEDRAFT_118953 [Aspergillus versicolor CBS 583.65]|uniref:Pisatin demethylase n=1 Tax=Aspergillus versicolor CBS 583.65 TaxID=1036611 RepID=A0A1L9P3P5_ASPVE|nr:uncharacterized protein ASPVEDRAFT_118953 [Aspergillus versicolor CBS 583.65]OJI96132.1 hypothetical protein ASPVEDRAFT_118953 [Aspergillus versicolor CBS 583.65]
MGLITDASLDWLLPSGQSRLRSQYDLYISPNLWLVALCTAVIYYLSVKFDRHLQGIPGPFWASFSSIWKTWDTYKGSSQYTAIALHRQYGALVRLGPKHVSVGDPAAIKTIYSVNGGFTKTAFYPIQAARYEKKPLMNLFATRDEAYHSRIKRPVAHTYSMAALAELEHKVDHVSRLFMEKLASFERENQAFDLGEWLQWYAFDVIGNLTFSRTLGFIEESRDVDNVISSIGSFFIYAAVVGQIPWLHKLLVGNPILPIVMPAIETFNPAVNFANKCMREMEAEEVNKGRDDFLVRFQKMAKEGVRGSTTGSAFGSADIVNHTSTNVLAGSDTTAIALRSIIHNLITNPVCYNRLRREIDELDQAGGLSDPVKESEARQMPYLQAIIKEGMRLHPSVGMLMERHVPKGGATICGKFIPEGYVVGMNPWVIGRDKGVYGEDADEFRPERWLDADPERLKEMERSSLAFGAGSRVCIGKNISMMEMSKLIPQLFRAFDIVLVAPEKDLKTANYW